MYRECKTPQSRRRQQHIMECLKKMMEQTAYHQITVSALCQEAEVPRKGFYRYFDTKDDVYALICNQMLDRCGDYCNQGAKNIVDVNKQKLVRFFEFWKENRSFLDGIARNDLHGVFLKIYMEYAIRQATNHVVGYDDRRKMQTVFAVCGMYTLVANLHQENYLRDPEVIADQAIRALTEPLVTHIDW